MQIFKIFRFFTYHSFDCNFLVGTEMKHGSRKAQMTCCQCCSSNTLVLGSTLSRWSYYFLHVHTSCFWWQASLCTVWPHSLLELSSNAHRSWDITVPITVKLYSKILSGSQVDILQPGHHELARRLNFVDNANARRRGFSENRSEIPWLDIHL